MTSTAEKLVDSLKKAGINEYGDSSYKKSLKKLVKLSEEKKKILTRDALGDCWDDYALLLLLKAVKKQDKEGQEAILKHLAKEGLRNFYSDQYSFKKVLKKLPVDLLVKLAHINHDVIHQVVLRWPRDSSSLRDFLVKLGQAVNPQKLAQTIIDKSKPGAHLENSLDVVINEYSLNVHKLEDYAREMGKGHLASYLEHKYLA